MADQDLSITPPSIAKSSTIATIGKSWGAVGPTGAASFELPLPLSAGRGWDPQLSLAYSSQTGNGPFGIGWSLGISQISRRTHKGVPHYSAHDEIIGHDGQVWMPELDDHGQILSRREDRYHDVDVGPHDVVRYWPRVESNFALREYWQPLTGAEPGFWLIHGADGSLQLYGKSAAARRADPDDPLRVFSWLLCESLNPHGEHIGFDYLADDQDLNDDRDCRAQRYLRAVFYGNASASQELYGWTQDSPVEGDWHFHLLFDYGERSTSLTEMPEYAGDTLQPWPVRPDPFSTFGQGFELGTRRLCRQVLMFHHFAEQTGATPVLVRRLLLEYSPVTPQSPFSQIAAAHYQARDADGFVEHTPPIEFEHSSFTLDPTPRRLLEQATQPGLDDRPYHCVDLFGEGLPGFLCRHDQCWYYREPLRASTGADAITYDVWTPLAHVPVADRNQAVQQLLTDLTGDGRLDWITAMPGMSGFRTLNADRSWGPFTAFAGFPVEFFQRFSQLGDFTGAGLDSLALIGPQAVRLYANQREAGFGAATDVEHLADDDRLPLISNARHELVLLGNLLGSDMTELCRIRHDEIRCWPNLGHGRFGKSRRISGPVFPYEHFDAARVRIADLDGSGAPALIYLNSDGFDIYLNRGGAGLETEAVHVPWPEGVRYDRLCQVTFADLQGLGCASLMLTVPHMTPRHWRYDFVSAKPYLLTASNNNMGCSAQVVYRSSAQVWLDEKSELRAQYPDRVAACHLPFPVQLVSQQMQLDEVTGNRLTQRFDYREGTYDGREREFRGFGRLQQLDSESATGDDDSSFTAPVRVCTWFHTGQAMDRSREGYFNRDADAVALGGTLFSRYHPADECDEPLTPPDAATEYEIARALAGSIARSETWAAADNPATACPYAVEEHRYRVREVRARGHYADSVLLPLALEKISYAYERLVDDPMCAHEVLLCADHYGLPTHTLKLNYPRRRQVTDTPPYSDPDEQQWWRDAHDEAQQSWYLSETLSRSIHLDQDPQQWRLGLPWQQRGNALILPRGTLPDGLTPEQVSHEQLTQHQNAPAWNALRVLTLQSVQRYLDSSDQSALPDGVASFEALAGPLEVAQLDKTALQAYGAVPPPFDIRAELKNIGYAPMPFLFAMPHEADDEQNLWSSQYSFARYAGLDGFHKVLEFHQTPSHGVTKAQYDPYHLALTRIELPDGCTTRVEYDYHALQPLRIIDANDNVQEALYEPSGQPLTLAFHGTENGQAAGFRPLSEYQRPEDHRPQPAIDNPALAVQKAASTLRKDLFSWMGQLPAPLRETRELFNEWVDAGLLLPSGHIRASGRRRLAQNSVSDAAQQLLIEAIAAVAREPVHSVTLSADRYPDDPIAAQIQISKNCVDGFGRVLQTQQLVEPGDAYAVDENGALIIEDGELLVRHADPRWRISERIEYNNKGLAVRQFRPFFADSHRYVNDASLREHGYFDQLFYDVLGRPAKVINAKGYFSRETRPPWYHISEDFNDTDEAEPQP
ncbi:SpvB/TcaC N-terminal domain-containing protein [Pseudomonas koreensis]|uniref:SpvB/TcaC N-terminal domain-containing protein n=1 Tax=Pseudomonas koreensis TaxID=198620 RepID=UPI001474D0E9|nr:SpvB/TcaC N-terminal domain-containing protein [Pseudomonas koreensis]NNA56988.1 toxin [Pseudomonas koreensis]